MQVIIEHSKDVAPYLGQYANRIETLGINHKVLEIEEKYLSWLSGLTGIIEPNFTIELGSNNNTLIKEQIDGPNMIIATIEAKPDIQEADRIYHMTAHTSKAISRDRKDDKCLSISCYSETHQTTAADYIKCVAYLKDLACQLHKPILIYANIYIPDEGFRYRSLTSKIINHYLEALNGGMIIKCTHEDNNKYYMPMRGEYEFYQDQVIYLSEDLKSTTLKALPFIRDAFKNKNWFKNMYDQYRQSSPLFENDVFYNSIQPNEEIYAFLDTGNYRPPEYYEALGLKTARLIGGYSMLYARKSQFDELSNILRQDVTPRHRIPIVSHAPCEREEGYPLTPYSLIAEELKYKGRDVYIGLITTDDVDYTNEVLRDQNGGTRIAYIWQQVSASEGMKYFKEQIDRALNSPSPGELIPIPENDSISTMMLGIAGGKSLGETYRGVATEAEFIVAKVKPASEAVQRIYGGMPSRYGVILQDAMIGVLELADFARERNRPLVLCLPFNTNIDPHDGSLILYEILALVARRAGITLIIPTGDEADKQHHYSTQRAGGSLSPLTLNVARANQNVIGVIYQRISSIVTAYLYPPSNIATGPIDLKQAGVTSVLEATVYSNGEEIDFLNGARRLLFRIESPQIGQWRLAGALGSEELSQINLWISQQELNPHITLRPSDTFTTLGSSACINNAMVVGGYDQRTGVMLSSSGRGYTWDERVRPLLVTGSSRITAPCRHGEWVSVTGTLPAVSIMAGVTATIYSKLMEEGRVPLPNTLGINNILLGVIRQSYGVSYPNPSEGYGVFDLSILNSLLNSPI
ncbi:hypothetical protein [Cellulosilyticum sp. I15G10I2]|uniref:hypothetical protein n=1 Tax=Cellulosilyticum sp. I15G10I2 TaxID=1892843 RepID=UPI00085C995C|nr:hypothetical protein [Cellulosilyticum sp. I15G10I2]